MHIVVLELTGKHENIRLGHLQLLFLFLRQARTCMASVNELYSVWGVDNGHQAKKGV